MTKARGWSITASAIVFTLLGLSAGWLAAGGASPRADSPAPDASKKAGVQLPAATLENLGVRVDKLQLKSFFRTVSVAAVVVDAPTTQQPVFAPIGGRIDSIEVRRGTTITTGQTVVTFIRDPLPRPELTLTSDVLRPGQERLHESVLQLRKLAEEVRISQTELERVERFTGDVGGRKLPVIPRQRAIDLRYQLARAGKAHEQAREELEKHGLTVAQIAGIERGASLPLFNHEMWQRALAHNGLWPQAAKNLSKVLPKSLRSLPWVTATIGELAASGLATPELAAWIATANVANHFLDIGVLLQRGHTLEDLERLHALNALEPVVRVLAPPLDAGAAWDVADVLTKRGAKVVAGQPLVALRDPRRLFLRTKPVGIEVGAILIAARERHRIVAKPFIRSSGPVLEDLTISYVESSRDNDGTVAFVEVGNTVASEIARESGLKSRTWALRTGLRYLLEVPTQKLDNVFVLPAAAVTEDGPNKIVFLQDGDSFKPVPVVIVYQDQEVAVIPVSNKVLLFPGDRVVHAGAFELGLAMKGSDAVDPHAGHQH